MYGNRFHQSRQDEPNFFAVDTDSDHHTLVSRGLPIYDSHQGSGPQHQTKSLIRSQVSDSPVVFDLFGDQQPMNHPQSSMLQSMKQQQSGFSDMQQLQQQLMLRKMQELQRQQQLRQLDARQQSVNPLFPFAKQGMGNYPSPLINGAASSDSLNKHWGTELGNMNWLQRASPVMQGSSDGLVFSSNHGQGQHLMGLVPQQGDQSLYGVPVCGSRGHVTQFSQLAEERSSMQQTATFGNCLPGNQYTVFPEQANIQDGSLISRQKFSGENHFGHSSGQALSPLMNMENLQQVNPMQRNASPLETQGRQELSALQEKSSTQFATSQNEVALDPTEERILFGSDDNIWAAFGTSSNMNGDSCGPFDTGGPNGFPSLQGGTWSALMQSAVAETSGSDIGLQEEWSSLNFQNTIVPPGNQHPTTYSEKQQTSFSNDLMPSSLNSSVFPSNNSIMNNDNQNVLGFQQLGNKFAFEPGNTLQANFSQKPVKSSEVGSKWSNAGPLQNAVAEANPIYRKASLSLDAETNIKSPSGPWTPVQTGLGQQYGNPNGGNILPSVARSGDASVSMHESENSSQHSQGSEQKRIMHGKVVHGGSLWNSSSIPSSTVEAEHAKSSGGSLQVNRDGFSVSSAAVMPNSSTAGVNELPSQYPSNSYQLNYWQNVNSAVKSQGGESVPMSHDHVNKYNQDMESSLNSCDQEEVQTTEMETCSRKENSSDNYRSDLYLHNSAGGSKETVWTHVSDSRSLPSGNQKSVNQIGQKICGARKFQFHPLGNLDEDVEPSYGMKQPSHLLAMSQQSRHFGQFPESSAGLAKGQSADKKDAKGIDDTTTCGTLPGHIQNASIPFDRSLCMYTPSKDSQSSSQNMLELLHKVDQSREHGSVMHFSSSECNLSSEMPEAENSDGSVGRLQRSHSSSQGFGLQLGPPSHRMAVPNQSFSSQSSLQTVNSLHQSQDTPEIREKGQSQFSATSSVQSLLPSEKPLGELKNNRSGLPGQASGNAVMHKIPGAFNSGFPYSRSELHYQQIVRASEQVSTNQNYNSGSFGGTSQQSNTNHPNARSPAEQVSYGEPVAVLRSLSASGIPQQGSSASAKLLPNMWSNFPGQSHLMGAQFNKVSAHVPQLHQQKVLESTSYAAYKQGNQDARTGHDSPSEFAASSMNKESSGHQLSTRNINPVHKLSEPQGSGPVPKNLSDVSPANSASMQKDLEAFGRSLKSNNILHQNFSLLNQMRAIKTAESDPNDRVSKRMKGAESSVEGQQVAPKTAELSENNIDVGNALTHNSAVSSGDSKMLGSSGAVDNAERKASSERGNIALQNLCEFSRDDSQSNHHGNNPASVRVEHSQISPQMAPSWFSQYGTFRNGQMLALYDAHKTTIKETMEQPFTLGKSSSGSPMLHSMEQATAAHVDTGQVGSIQPSSTPTSAAHFALPQSLPLRVLRPKKRKRATSELIPWHKEVSLQSQNLQTISLAEVDWAKAANRLTEKVKDEVKFIEDEPPMLRAKRRLTLTTQLMQQLLRPPRYAILSADADSNYKSVAYTISRLALGDLCGLVSRSSSDSDIPDDVVNLHSDKCKKSERVDDRHLLKFMEDFIGRARQLENNLLRLDKRASVLDLSLECQELEKFSVINRFAKFHGRGQAESSGASSSSDAAANALKPFPQRYVTALPIPRNLPDGVQCLSL